MTNFKSAVCAALFSTVASIALPTAALAQDAGADSSDDIVVTGLRQQYRGDVPLTEIPQSVQTIDGELLKDLNITGLDGALDLASGISRQNNFGGLWDSFAIRGFAGDENFPSGFLVNGFNGGRGYGGPRDASNIQSIEILKGPNGAVFGRGEPGGTVNIITKKADLTGDFGSFAVSAGSFSTFRVEGDYNLALSETVAIRFNGAAQDAESFRDRLKSNKIVATPSILFAPTDRTKISYEMEYVNNEVPFDRGVVAVNGVLGLIPNSRFLGEPGDGPTKVKVLGHQFQLQQELSSDWYLLVGAGYRDTSFEGFSSDPELAGSRQTLEETGNFLSRQRRLRDYDATNTTIRAELSGKLNTGSIVHHVLVGADWDKFELDLLQWRFRPGPYTAGTPITDANNAIDIFNPVYGKLPVASALIQDVDQVQKAWGIYFQDQIDITDRIKLRLGGRYDHFRMTTQTATTPLVTVKKRFSPTAGALFEITDTLSIYGGYGEGFRPNSGTAAPVAPATVGAPFEPETSESFEGGLRYVSPDKAITATLAAYSMKKTNILTSDPRNANFSMTAGSARSRGIEADVTASLPGGLFVLASYAFTDAEWSTSAADKDFGLTILKGDPLINIPKHTANLLVTKEFEISETGKVTMGAGVNHVGKRLGETGTVFYLPSYTLVRALASYEPNESMKFSLDVSNLFDKRYYPASYHRYWVAPGAPRAITGKVSFFF
jgi:iron complex outermembrane receptor protein